MSDLQAETIRNEEIAADAESSFSWGESAPKGGKTVLSRILKDGSKVPLFLGQTLVNSLRDMGYNSTTSALCEQRNSPTYGFAPTSKSFISRVVNGSP